MPAYSGKFQHADESGGALAQGACELSFDEETCVVTPAEGDPIAFDLGDVDSLAPAEWSLGLTLFTGHRIELRQFGAAFGRMSQELTAAWRDRTVRCLLLEDLEEIARYDATVNGVPSQVRLYGSNLAVLPLAGLPEQWRLADIDSLAFDDASYSLNLASGDRRLSISKLAKKTDDFRARLGGALDAIRRRTAEALHRTFPFLNPAQLQALGKLMPEGRSACLAAMEKIHPKLPEAFCACAVDETLRPYFDALRSRAAAGSMMAGFKFVRENEEPGSEEGESPEEPGDNPNPLFFWFFFPIADRNLAAWEGTTGSGRATYFFKTGSPAAAAIEKLTRGLALVNFRREPVYLSDESLDRQAKFHRYAIGARKLPDLRALRAAYAGRAIHSSIEEWAGQVAGI